MIARHFCNVLPSYSTCSLSPNYVFLIYSNFYIIMQNLLNKIGLPIELYPLRIYFPLNVIIQPDKIYKADNTCIKYLF